MPNTPPTTPPDTSAPTPVVTPQAPLPPHPPSTLRHRIIGASIILGSLFFVVLAGLLYWPSLSQLFQLSPQTLSQLMPPNSPPEPITQEATIPAEIPTLNDVPTSTPPEEPAPMTCTAPDGTSGAYLGDHIALLRGDGRYLCRPKEQTPFLVITAQAFADSRCPVNVTCVWAGEQTVDVDLIGSGALDVSETVQLSPQRKKTGTFTRYPVTITLHSIDEGKGGTYADVVVTSK